LAQVTLRAKGQGLSAQFDQVPDAAKTMAVQKRKRVADPMLAKARAAAKKARLAAKGEQEETEAKHRASGGYGKSVVSIYAEPKGGIKNSPAYLKVLSRWCA